MEEVLKMLSSQVEETNNHPIILPEIAEDIIG